MRKPLLLFPFGGNAKEALISILAINALRPEWDVIGFVDDNQAVHGRVYAGVSVLGGKEQFAMYPDASVLAVPGSPSGYLRRKTIIQSLGIDASRFATIIHPSVVRAPDAAIGCNTVLMPNVIVSCSVRIGDHCVVLPNTVISHDATVGAYCCIGSNVSISGSVQIGSECYVGSGVRVREGTRIGERSLIGLGSNVLTDVVSETVVVGNPARPIK